MEWQIVKPHQVDILAEKLARSKAIVFDTETTSQNIFLGAKALGIGLSPFEEEKHYYLPIEKGLPPKLLKVLETKPLIGHNIKFDLHVLKRLLGWHGTQASFLDTIVLARLWAPEERPQLGLKELVQRIFGFTYPDERVVRTVKAGKAASLSVEDIGYYCCLDVQLTKRLYNWFKEQLPQEVLRLFVRETYLTRDLFDMEAHGVMIDQDYLEQAISLLDSRIEELLTSIRTASGITDLNPRSNPQKRQLMEKLGIAPINWGKTGPSWSRKELLAVRQQHPIALDFAKYNALTYQRSGLVERARKYIAAGLDSFHFEFKNWGTVTGRLSGDGQQLPKGWLQFGEAESVGDEILVWKQGQYAKEREFSLRRLIRPRPGHVLLKADYKQIEMFVLGFYMQDPTFNDWLESGNVHAAAALEVFGDAEKYYDRGKIYNFATVYGQGDKARAKSLNYTIEEAAADRQRYEARMPGYRKLLYKVRRLLEREGYISNVYGRHYVLEPHLAYRGVNYLCQGSAGDFVKFKLPDTRELRKQIGAEALITTHDDFTAEIPIEQAKYLPEWLEALQPSPFGRDLKLDADYSYESLVDLQPLEELLKNAA